MQRQARCHCQKVTVTCAGEPEEVVQCHCRACQRRTGSAFNIAAWFHIDNVEIDGTTRQYTRTGDLKIETSFNFCPNCGSNMFWTSDSESIGIAVGCFEDPSFPPPTVTLYDSCRHAWINPLDTETHSENGETD